MKFAIQPEFTNHCNFRCRFCPHSVYRKESEGGNQFNRDKGYMSDELFNVVLENAGKYAKLVTIGFFGEPLLHPRFEDYVRSFPTNRRYSLDINTNWSLVTKENLDILKLFDCVRISLDAPTPALWEELCPGAPVSDLNGVPCQNRYDTIVDKIEYWLSLPDHAPTRLVYVVSSTNKYAKKNFVEKWRPKLGLRDHILTKSVISYGGVMKDSYMKCNSCNIESQPCFTVAWNGDCTPCNLDVNIELKVGNLLAVRDMKQIVEGERWREIMSTIRQKSGICSNCFDANNWTENKIYFRNWNLRGLVDSVRRHWVK